MDIVFARLALSEIPDNLDLSNELLLRNLDVRCIRSLNGLYIASEKLYVIITAVVIRPLDDSTYCA